MRSLLVVLVVALFAVAGYAVITKDAEYELNQMNYAANKHSLGTIVSKVPNLLVAKYSYAVQGGSTTADISLLRDLTDTKSYAKLPDNAIVQHVWLDIITKPASAGTNATVAVKAESAGDLLPATSTNVLIAGRYRGAPRGGDDVDTYVKLTAERTIKATIAKSSAGQASPLNAGVFNVYIQYILGD